MSLEEREVSESIKALKTIRVHGTGVSIDPSEVIDRPGYLEARRQAAVLVQRRDTISATGHLHTWEDVDALGMRALTDLVMESLLESRVEGLSLEQALKRLGTFNY